MKTTAVIETGKNLDYDIYTIDQSLGFMLLGQGKTIGGFVEMQARNGRLLCEEWQEF